VSCSQDCQRRGPGRPIRQRPECLNFGLMFEIDIPATLVFVCVLPWHNTRTTSSTWPVFHGEREHWGRCNILLTCLPIAYHDPSFTAGLHGHHPLFAVRGLPARLICENPESWWLASPNDWSQSASWPCGISVQGLPNHTRRLCEVRQRPSIVSSRTLTVA